MTWNVNGLKRKIGEYDFLHFISQFDIIFLSETWISKTENTNFDIDGYVYDYIPGNKTRRSRKGRFSGGISLYYKSELENYITVLEKHQCGIFWIKLSSVLFPFDEDVYLCNLYNPPNSSNVFKSFDIDIYDQLEAGIIKYNALGKVFVSGDFNSRTSDSIDYILYDKYIDHNLQFFDPTDIPLRKSQDQITDYNGLKLLDVCLSTGLLIANGRLHDDRNVGKYTFCSQNGQSVVDYVLLNLLDFDCISYFDVLNFNEYSDHAPITVHLNLKPKNTKSETPSEDSFISRKIVSDDSKINLFHS